MSALCRLSVRLIWGAILLIDAFSVSAATVKIEVVYSQAANTFDIMDNVSNWWPGFCEEAYQKYWTTKFPLSTNDKNLFDRYRIIREAHYSDPDQADKDPLKNRNGLFATLGAITADPVSEAFYSSETLDEAFKKLSSIVKREELTFLREFYLAFADRYNVFLNESEPFKLAAKSILSTLQKPGIGAYFDKIARFYRVKADITYRVLYIWWPPLDRTNASPTGRFLLMRYNPVKHVEEAKQDTDVVFHEMIHTISARQDLTQKRSLTKEFISGCDTKGKIKKLNLLEEPLAVALGQALFFEKFESTRFKYDSNWYFEKWTNMFSKLIYPSVKEEFEAGRTITDGIVSKAARHCRDVMVVVDKFSSP